MTLTYEQEVLKAMLRLSRRQRPSTQEALSLRVGGTDAELTNALRLLDRAGLINLRDARPPSLTLEGLAVGVALSGRAKVTPKVVQTRLAA